MCCLQQHFGIDLCVKLDECSLGVIIETSNATLNRSHFVLKDRERKDNVSQTTSRNDIVHDLLLEGLANDVCPIHKICNERIILDTNRFSVLGNDFRFNRSRSVVLLVSETETLKEGFVHLIRTDESTVIGSLTLRVGSRHDSESRSRTNELSNLRNELALAFKNALKAHDQVSSKIDFIEKQNRSTGHGNKCRTRTEHRLTILQAEATDEFIFISLSREIHTNALTTKLSASLFNHCGFAVA